MPGFDSLIGKSLGDAVRNNLGQKTADKIEQRLFEKHGISLAKAAEEAFPKLDSVLREFFGDGVEGIEKQFLQHMIEIEKTQKENKEWLTIEDKHLTKLILESIGDDDKKNIMNVVLDQSKIISDILETCKIPQTSGYRKINSLIEDGFLIVNGYQVTRDGKRVNKYMPIFKNIRIQIEKNKVLVQVQLTKESISNSVILQLLRGKEQLVKMA
jgi:hypothetical protein